MKKGYDKEAIYDEQIQALTEQIINICKREEIPMIASVYLVSEDIHLNRKPLFCTTALPFEGNTPDWIHEVILMFERGTVKSKNGAVSKGH